MTDWPVSLRGVTESVVTTLGPNDRYNVAALGIHAPETAQRENDSGERKSDTEHARVTDTEHARVTDTEHARARTWGRTRTRRNFEARGEGWVQFVRDPVLFVDAALGIREVDEPTLDDADAWVRIEVDRLGTGREGGTEWADWRLVPVEREVRRRVVPTFNRGYAAVVEATVAASRLDVESYDTDRLRDRLAYFENVARRCGGPEERAAIERLHERVDVDGDGNGDGDDSGDVDGDGNGDRSDEP